MQLLAERLQSLVESAGLKQSAMEALVRETYDGKDAWGNDLLLELRDEPPGFLLISLGSDAELDVSTPSAYFALEAQDVHDSTEADLVFRDGEAVTYAGK